MTSIKWYCLWIERSEKVLILLVFKWFWDCIFSCLLDEILWIECDFGVSSRKCLIYKGFVECEEVIIYIFKLSDNLVLLGNIRVLSKWVSKLIWGFWVNCAGIWYNLWCKGWGEILSWILSVTCEWNTWPWFLK